MCEVKPASHTSPGDDRRVGLEVSRDSLSDAGLIGGKNRDFKQLLTRLLVTKARQRVPSETTAVADS